MDPFDGRSFFSLRTGSTEGRSFNSLSTRDSTDSEFRGEGEDDEEYG